MKITALVENTSRMGLPVEHGLSLLIRMDDGCQVLFDMGQRRLFAENAERLGLDLSQVDMAVVSHGHYDHGGGLRAFLNLNDKARVYVNGHAFEPHYSLRTGRLRYIGLDADLKSEDRLVLCGEETRIGNDLLLFSGADGDCLRPAGNKQLYGPTKDANDDFCHEQSLIVREGGKTVLFAGCAHGGIVNIMQKGHRVAGSRFTYVVAGMHLMESGLTDEAEAGWIRKLAARLKEEAGCRYLTMHCTGMAGYEALRKEMGETIGYLSCGETVEI